MNKNKWFLNGGRGSGRSLRLLCETYENKIAALEKENTELRQAKEGKVVEHFEAYGQCRDSRRIAELEAENERLTVSYETLKLHDEEEIGMLKSENAELKKKNLATQDAVTMQMYTNKANKEIADRQLTKAKDLLAKWVELFKPKVGNIPPIPIQVETERFLSELEK